LRQTEEIARRAVALCLVAGRAEGLELEAAAELVAHFGVVESLTPAERLFLFSPGDPDPEVARRFQWGYEASCALLWILGYVDALGPPDAPCDAKRVSDIVTAAGSTPQLVEGARARSVEELVAEADRTERLWAECERALESEDEPQGILCPVVHQRHRAYRWALDREAPGWDEIAL
jgi:hypothetical protein